MFFFLLSELNLLLKIRIDTDLFNNTGFGAGYGSVVYTLPGELLAPEDKSIGGAAGEASRMIVTAIALKVLFFCWNKY